MVFRLEAICKALVSVAVCCEIKFAYRCSFFFIFFFYIFDYMLCKQYKTIDIFLNLELISVSSLVNITVNFLKSSCSFICLRHIIYIHVITYAFSNKRMNFFFGSVWFVVAMRYDAMQCVYGTHTMGVCVWCCLTNHFLNEANAKILDTPNVYRRLKCR